MKVMMTMMMRIMGFLLHYGIFLVVLQGAIQELKLYGMPGVAEVQCDDTLSVGIDFNIATLMLKRHMQTLGLMLQYISMLLLVCMLFS